MPAASNILPFDKSYAAQQASSRDRSRSTRETQEDGPAFSDSLDQARRNEAEPKRETGNAAAGRDKTDAPTSETQSEAGRSGETGGSEGKRDSAASGGKRETETAGTGAETGAAADKPARTAALAAAAGVSQTVAGTAAPAGEAQAAGAAGAAQATAARAAAQTQAAPDATAQADAAEGDAELPAAPRAGAAKGKSAKAPSLSTAIAQNNIANAAAATAASQNPQALQTGAGGGANAGASHSTIIQAMDSQLSRGFSFADGAALQQGQAQPDTAVQSQLQHQQPTQPTVQTAQSTQAGQTFHAHLQQQMPQPAMPAAHQLSVSIARGAREGADKIDIQLHPAELGRVEVKLEVGHDGRVMAVVSADRSDTLDQLRRDVNQLAKALADAGFDTDQNSFTFQDRREGGGAEGDQKQGGGMPGDPAAQQAVPETVLTSTGRTLSLDRIGVDLSV